MTLHDALCALGFKTYTKCHHVGCLHGDLSYPNAELYRYCLEQNAPMPPIFCTQCNAVVDHFAKDPAQRAVPCIVWGLERWLWLAIGPITRSWRSFDHE